ncbi:MAG: putative toxin-antitoxin system toxin component, PIN family [Nitrospinae bacterium]|nr:putative toxin-antitoxin system toxin component, PIN family [Nitrospinota bacterium]
MKVVLDTNVLLSGLILPQSIPGQIINAWRKSKFDLVLSEPLLEEIGRALRYPKISNRLKWDGGKISLFLELLRLHAQLADISGINARVPRDPQDNHVLATMLAGHADVIVTGDAHLLYLKDEYPILTPREFAASL